MLLGTPRVAISTERFVMGDDLAVWKTRKRSAFKRNPRYAMRLRAKISREKSVFGVDNLGVFRKRNPRLEREKFSREGDVS